MPRDPLDQSGDCREDWRRINEVDSDVYTQDLGVRSLRAVVADMQKATPVQREAFHPFKIYRFPSRLRDPGRDPIEIAKDWRRFTVRAGKVFGESALGINVSGTDGANTDPYDDSMPSAGDFLVPDATAAYYLWVEVAYVSSAWVANIRHAANPLTAAAGENNPNPWSTWPAMDGHRILLGVVDTNTRTATKEVLVRQYIRTDILLGPIFNVCVEGVEKPYAIPGLAKGEL